MGEMTAAAKGSDIVSRRLARNSSHEAYAWRLEKI